MHIAYHMFVKAGYLLCSVCEQEQQEQEMWLCQVFVSVGVKVQSGATTSRSTTIPQSEHCLGNEPGQFSATVALGEARVCNVHIYNLFIIVKLREREG